MKNKEEEKVAAARPRRSVGNRSRWIGAAVD
jgi:hypothetical protein